MWSRRRDSNPRPSPWQGMSTYFADLCKHTETASGLLFQLITGSRCFAACTQPEETGSDKPVQARAGAVGPTP